MVEKKCNCILKYDSLIMTKLVLVIYFCVYAKIDVFEHSQKRKIDPDFFNFVIIYLYENYLILI